MGALLHMLLRSATILIVVMTTAQGFTFHNHLNVLHNPRITPDSNLYTIRRASRTYHPFSSVVQGTRADEITSIHNSKSNTDEIAPQKIPWLIIGGGIHGVHIAARLLGEVNGIPNIPKQQGLRIVDPHPQLLHQWKARTASTGMKYLRSSGGYHLDLKENDLREFPLISNSRKEGFVENSQQHITVGKKHRKRKRRQQSQSQSTQNSNDYFTNDYQRPRLDFFNEHCDSVISKYDLDPCHIRGTVTEIDPHDDFVSVVISSVLENDQCVDGDNEHRTIYHADKVVLALGNDEPLYPEWVQSEDVEQGLVQHLLDVVDFADDIHKSKDKSEEECSSIAVIGGGITAAHKAMELVHKKKKNPNTSIHIISRHPWKEQQFDTHQDWMMDQAASKRSELAGGYGKPKKQEKFSESSWEERRRIIGQERIPGTVTPALFRGNNGLSYAIQNGDVRWHEAEVAERINTVESHTTSSASGAFSKQKNGMHLLLSCGTQLNVDKVLLATGFGKRRPGSALVNNLIEMAGLDTSDLCGYPIVDENLSWHSRIFVAGGLAELELGPSARNIAGARLAAERIVQTLS